MKHHLKTAIKILFLVIVAGIVYYHFRLSPVSVQTAIPKQQDLMDTVFGTGTLEAKTVVSISPRSTGQLVELFADQGDNVKTGQTLCKMAADDLKQQLKMSENELEVTKATIKRQATIKRLDAEIASAQATYDYAQLAFQRSERLFKANVETQADFDKQTEARKVAASALARAQAQKNEAELTMVKQSAQIEYNRTKLAETILTSPFDGVVIRRNRESGAVVNPGVSIMEIAATDEIWASVWVDEITISKLKIGQKAQVVFRSQPDQPYSATVRRLSRETDRETREFMVDLALEKLPDNWTLGQRLEANIMIQKLEGRLCVPTKMIRWEKNSPFILVLDNGRIGKRPLKLGLQTKMATEIIEGLSTDDRLVLFPDDHLPHIGRKAEVREP